MMISTGIELSLLPKPKVCFPTGPRDLICVFDNRCTTKSSQKIIIFSSNCHRQPCAYNQHQLRHHQKNVSRSLIIYTRILSDDDNSFRKALRALWAFRAFRRGSSLCPSLTLNFNFLVFSPKSLSDSPSRYPHLKATPINRQINILRCRKFHRHRYPLPQGQEEAQDSQSNVLQA